MRLMSTGANRYVSHIGVVQNHVALPASGMSTFAISSPRNQKRSVCRFDVSTSVPSLQPSTAIRSTHHRLLSFHRDHREMSTAPTEWDLIIIGAGIYGIQVARTYLELHPTRRIVILEASGEVGGVWSKREPDITQKCEILTDVYFKIACTMTSGPKRPSVCWSFLIVPSTPPPYPRRISSMGSSRPDM